MVTPENKPLSWKKQVLFSFIIVVVLLGAGEGAIRTWALFFRTSYERYNFATGRLELVPGVRQTTTNGDEFIINSKGFLGPEFEEIPLAGVYRIIAIGDSCTFADGIWTHAYPGMLGDLLNADNAQRKFEVINGGIEGYNSNFALERIQQEIVRYQPRLVVIYIGWNDLMKTNPENLSATGKDTFLTQFMESSYLVKAYSKVMFQYLRPLVFQPKIQTSNDGVQAFEAFVPRTYEDNLKAMIEVLQQNGVDVILGTLPTVVHPLMTGEEIKKRNVFFPYYAGTYSVTKFLVLLRAYNDVIRNVGAKFNVPVVDLDEIFNSYRGGKNSLFWDTMHPSAEGHSLIAKSLGLVIQKELH